jgi:hypothetical protein
MWCPERESRVNAHGPRQRAQIEVASDYLLVEKFSGDHDPRFATLARLTNRYLVGGDRLRCSTSPR